VSKELAVTQWFDVLLVRREAWVRCSVRTYFAPTLGALQTSGGDRVPEAVALVSGKFTRARSRTPGVLWVTIFGRQFFKRDCRGLDSHYRIEQ
jgi:hypothetical protein